MPLAVEGKAYRLRVPFRSLIIGVAVVSGLRLRDTQSRIGGIVLGMEGFCRQELTRCNLQVAKNAHSNTLGEVARPMRYPRRQRQLVLIACGVNH